MEKNVKKKDKSKLLILLLLLISLLALGVAAWALLKGDSGPTLTPDYAPQETEQHA